MSETTTTRKIPTPPVGLIKLGTRKDGPGRTLWKQIVDKYDLRPDELRILEDACHLADRIHLLSEGAKGDRQTVRGSTGQQVINPLLAEERQCRVALATLLGKLKLPDDGAGIGDQTPRSVSARGAAQARWGTNQ